MFMLCLVFAGVSKNDHLYSMKAEVLARIPLSTYVVMNCGTWFIFVHPLPSSSVFDPRQQVVAVFWVSWPFEGLSIELNLFVQEAKMFADIVINKP